MDAILEYLYQISLQERLVVLLELLLIGIVVYWAVSFLEGTRGERLFRGVLFVLVIGAFVLKVVVERFDLERVAYLYNGVALLAILIIAIAFQPEIRRALIRIGQASFLSSSPQQLTRSVEEIIKAVSQLASTRTGALLVIEQQVGLGEFVETGVRVDSKVSADLLRTIFYPGTALHDMAVVIRGDRIIAARVQLPLAEESASLSGKQIGSRHRAAMGISTSTDAIVIVVSEETGIVSLAINGHLVRNISEAQLRRHLTTAVVETTPIVEKMQEVNKSTSEGSGRES
ncbi:DNA integrity scanning protein DisA [Anaerohalosphaera lusitana]|uniref:Diadenylate cyclase n=1 Tax=Anaerohalosphaera lusitana TaxID=1936003 RepID=A0A1U9NHR0_9BACT|nr:diadenylate cyclase CdaA [Anaerohalosphaera lusitana]AQT67307.1 DNA integrity scanning protein DisA [Anaerohalosphaera lusitana]